MNSYLVLLTFSFCSGILLAYSFRFHFWPSYFVGSVFLIISVIFLKKRVISHLLLACFVLTLGALHYINASVIPKNSIIKLIPLYGRDISIVRGFINSDPHNDGSKVSFFFRVEELRSRIKNYNVCGDLLVYAKEDKGLVYGEELILFARISRPYWAVRSGLSGVIGLKGRPRLTFLKRNRGSFLRKFAYFLKHKIHKLFLRLLSPQAAGVSAAMVLGEKKMVSPVIYDSMIKSGTVHILVVSGFNVGIIAFISGFIFKTCRIPRRIRYMLIMFSLVLYCFVTGASTPVVRATIMGIFFLLGSFIKREANVTHSLVLAAFFILIISPKELFSASFQLSFVSVAAIVYLYPRIKLLVRSDKINNRFIKSVAEGMLLSFSAWLGTVGIIAYYFKILSPITVISNIFIAPLAALITITSLIVAVAGLVMPYLASPLASVNEILVVVLLFANTFFAGLPFAYRHL